MSPTNDSSSFLETSLRITASGHVKDLFAGGIGSFLERLSCTEQAPIYMERMNRLLRILDRDLPEEKITGFERSLDVVVDIFNQVNSAGTKLSKGDLALARLCARTPNARQILRSHLRVWEQGGIHLSLDLLLRSVTAVATGRAALSGLEALPPSGFEQTLVMTARSMDTVLETLASRFGLDHDRALLGRAALPLMCRLLSMSGGMFANDHQRDKAIYWYIRSALAGRHAASTITMLNRDLMLYEKHGVDGLVAELDKLHGGAMLETCG